MPESSSIRLLAEAIMMADIATSTALLQEHVALKGYHATLLELLEPTLEELGKAWESGEGMSLAQGYVAGKVTEQFMRETLEKEPRSSEETRKGVVILGNIEDDFHSLGRRLVAIFLESAGWQVVDLGNDVSAKDFVDTAVAHGARVVGASAMMYTTARNIRHLREEIDRRGHTGRIMLAVGGAVFKLRPELVEKVGGDGTSGNALTSPALFARLWNQSAGAPHE